MVMGCKSAQKPSDADSTDGTTVKTKEFNFSSGSKVPDGFDNYGETKSAEELMKATGYEYDKDSLTYELLWEDNFDGNKLNEEYWSYETGGSGWGNNEIQYYTNGDNCSVKDGILTIELRKDQDENGKEKVTSSRIKTAGKVDFRYGKVEMRAKLPQGRGTWPAFWMMPSKSVYGGWPVSGEIDIMEAVGYMPNVAFNTVHNKAFNGMNGLQKGKPTYHIDTMYDEYHTYGVEWLPDRMVYYIDGEETFVYDPHEYADPVLSDQWPYDQEFFIILNFAWGGNWGGARGVDETCLPQKYQIDYVRVYQSPEITALTAEK